MPLRPRQGSLFKVRTDSEKFPQQPGLDAIKPTPEQYARMTPAEKTAALMRALGRKWNPLTRRWT